MSQPDAEAIIGLLAHARQGDEAERSSFAGRVRERLRPRPLVDHSTRAFPDWLEASDGRGAAQALVAWADRERAAELTLPWRRLPDLPPDARNAIERSVDHLAQRRLRQPLEHLGPDPDHPFADAVRQVSAP